eukprot:2715464-Pyramimonas_sp.AAC.1
MLAPRGHPSGGDASRTRSKNVTHGTHMARVMLAPRGRPSGGERPRACAPSPRPMRNAHA